MALNSYTDLLSEITDWLDEDLASKADTFIRMAEARFNRLLRTPEMETPLTLEASDESTPLPTDFLQMKAMWIDGDYKIPLNGTSFANLNASGPAGLPTTYAIVGTSLYLGPIPDDVYDLAGVYYQTIPPLTVNAPTNWLLAAHPDLYLYGCLTMAELRGWNDTRLPLLKSALDEAMGQIQMAGTKRRFGGPLVPTGMRQTGIVKF